MEFQGTKGGWIAKEQSIQGQYDINNDKGVWLASVMSFEHANFSPSQEQSKANAQLIASAPILIKRLINTYVELLSINQVNFKHRFTAEGQMMLSGLRCDIANALGLEQSCVQEYCKNLAIKRATEI